MGEAVRPVITWTELDRARAMVESQRRAGRTVLPSFAEEIAVAIRSEVEQRTYALQRERDCLKEALEKILRRLESGCWEGCDKVIRLALTLSEERKK